MLSSLPHLSTFQAWGFFSTLRILNAKDEAKRSQSARRASENQTSSTVDDASTLVKNNILTNQYTLSSKWLVYLQELYLPNDFKDSIGVQPRAALWSFSASFNVGFFWGEAFPEDPPFEAAVVASACLASNPFEAASAGLTASFVGAASEAAMPAFASRPRRQRKGRRNRTQLLAYQTTFTRSAESTYCVFSIIQSFPPPLPLPVWQPCQETIQFDAS